VSEIGIVLSALGHLACVFNNLLGLILTREYLQLDGLFLRFLVSVAWPSHGPTPLAAGHLESLMGRSHFRKTLVFLDIPVLFVLCPFVLEPWSSPASGFWLLGSSLLSPFIVHHSALRRFPPAGFLLQASGCCFPSLSFILPAFTTGLCVAPARHRRAADPAYRGDEDQNGQFSFRISNIVGSFDVPPTENALGGSTLSTLEFGHPSPGFFAMVNRTPDRELPASLTIPKIPSLTV
jgi:hypothetical protein